MSNKEKIIDLFYNEHLNPVDIALELNVNNAYISKVIKKDFRYHEEKNQRKQHNKQKQFINKKEVQLNMNVIIHTICIM